MDGEKSKAQGYTVCPLKDEGQIAGERVLKRETSDRERYFTGGEDIAENLKSRSSHHLTENTNQWQLWELAKLFLCGWLMCLCKRSFIHAALREGACSSHTVSSQLVNFEPKTFTTCCHKAWMQSPRPHDNSDQNIYHQWERECKAAAEGWCNERRNWRKYREEKKENVSQNMKTEGTTRCYLEPSWPLERLLRASFFSSRHVKIHVATARG